MVLEIIRRDNHPREHTHTHNHFMALLDFVRDYPGKLASKH